MGRYIARFSGEPAEAMRLIGDEDDLQLVYKWLESHGLEWLKGDTERPETLTDSKGDTHTPGLYIRPKFGQLRIRNKEGGRLSVFVSYGDWVIKADGPNTPFFALGPTAFWRNYTMAPSA